ncbi:hypothetical protein BX600DRAFT_469552 [Xylariales sp. PMI_506]|nr:hypothetical protein BX600DRAFT_469552 [Xylariales sp. PMI_506]
MPDAQEMTNFACDYGCPPSELQANMAKEGWPVDLSLVGENWVDKAPGTRCSPSSTAITVRARDARRYLKAQGKALLDQNGEDVHMAFVSHGGYLHFFTDDWEDGTSREGTAWTNCATRTYVFETLSGVSNDADDDALLRETAESRARRGKMNPPPGLQEQRILSAKTMEWWESLGLANPSKIKDTE